LKQREVTFLIIALLLAAIIGGLIGDVIGTFLPPGAAKTLFTRALVVGFDTVKVDFYAISFTIGLTFKINFMSVLVVLLVIVYFRWWYL
jgi:hypothetical protein